MSCLEVLIRTAFQAFSNGSKSSKAKASPEQLKLVEALGKCTAKDVNLVESMKTCTGKVNGLGKRAPITYIDVFEHSLFTIGIFVLHPNSIIPLHDHPGMSGFIKVLTGQIKITSYTRVKKINQAQLIVSEESSILTESSPVATLAPTERNYHQLEYVAGGDDQQEYAAFLDILAPPYSSIGSKPECNYYFTIPCSPQPAGVSAKPIAELWKCPCPRDFFNDIAAYMGPDLTQVGTELK